VALVLI